MKPDPLKRIIEKELSDTGFEAKFSEYKKFGGFLIVDIHPVSYEAKTAYRFLVWKSLAVSLQKEWHDDIKMWYESENEKCEKVNNNIYRKYVDALNKINEWAEKNK